MDPLAVQLVVVVLGAAIILSLAIVSLSSVEHSARSANEFTQAQLLAGSIDRGSAEIERHFYVPNGDKPSDRPQESAASGTSPSVSRRGAVEIARLLDGAADDAEELHRLVGSIETLELWGAAGDARDFLERFLDEPD